MTFFRFIRPSRNIYRWPRITGWALHLFPQRLQKLVRFPPALRLPSRALSLWRDRADLKAEFDLRGTTGRRALMRWFLCHGCREAVIRPDAEEAKQLALLHEPHPGVKHLTILPITWLMVELTRHESPLKFEIDTQEGQERILSWVFRKGLAKYNLLHLITESQAVELLAPIEGGAPRLLKWLWDAESDLQSLFDGPNDPQFRDWLQGHGAALCPLLTHPLIGLADATRRAWDPTLPFGVNLIGHARARLGVGEDVRMAALALSSANIPFVIRDLPAGDLGPPSTSTSLTPTPTPRRCSAPQA